MPEPNTETPVFAFLSGGVDSAVAASLLAREFANVTGITHRHWPESRCCSTECIDRCAEQCADMGLPYAPVECIVEFAQQIVEDFVASYERGVTPNPCVLCNAQIRFGLTVEKHFRLKGESLPERYIMATGHYARVRFEDGRYRLLRGCDETKDQSYMLHRLTQDELAHARFPLGEMKKTEVRAIAEALGLKSAKIGDSQDVCFVQDTYQDFLRQYSEVVQRPGPFVDLEGTVLGEHKGAAYYTRGQRSGLGLHGGPWYVLHIDPKDRVITLGRREDLASTSFRVRDLHWNAAESSEPFMCRVQTRYRGVEIPCRVTLDREGGAQVLLDQESFDLTPGQSAVFYTGDYVVAGGFITAVGPV